MLVLKKNPQGYRGLGNNSWIHFTFKVSQPSDFRPETQEHHANGNLIPVSVTFFFFVLLLSEDDIIIVRLKA